MKAKFITENHKFIIPANNLANGAGRIFQVHKQVVTFQIKMYNVLRMQILHSKCRIHGNYEFLAMIEMPVDQIPSIKKK